MLNSRGGGAQNCPPPLCQTLYFFCVLLTPLKALKAQEPDMKYMLINYISG